MNQIDHNYAKLYGFLQTNSNTNSIVIVPLSIKDDLSLFILSERLPYVAKGAEFTQNSEVYNNRVKTLEDIYHATDDSQLRNALKLVKYEFTDREIYILFERELEEGKFPLSKVYSDSNYYLYKLI